MWWREERRAPAGRAGALWLTILIAAGSGCGDGQDPRVTIDDGALRGTLAIYISDHPDGHSETHYFLRGADDREQPLRFDTPPNLDPGTPLKVWGVLQPDGLRVLSLERLPAAPSVPVGLVAATPYAPRSFAFVLVDIGGGVDITADTVMQRLITDPDSIRNYYLGDSYGMQDITADVFGPFSYPLTDCNNIGTLSQVLRDKIPGSYQHYLWYLGSRTSVCDWSGLASLGTPDSPSRDTWYNGSTSCVVLVQEPGHNFGMQHSSSLSCDGVALADDPNSCSSNEYGDAYDPMGSGCRHMNAWQKAYQGWFGGCNGVNVTSSGTFTLLPFEQSCNGAQFLKIKAPKTRYYNRPAGGGGGPSTETFAYYYLELRTPVDFDGTLGNPKGLSPMVLVHIADDLHSRSSRGVHTFLLDMTPDTGGRAGLIDAGLGVGQTYTDPAGGLSITVQDLSADKATIVVDMPGSSGASPTCLDGSNFAMPGPGPEVCGPTPPPGTIDPGAGAGGGPSGAGGGPAPTGVDPIGPSAQLGSGCTCATGAAPATPAAGALLAVGLIALAGARRRSRRA
jgi:MYXO-CTERM domain-containing protein